MPSFMQLLTVAAVLTRLVPSTLGHTWVEEFQAIDTNSSFIGARGFSRGYTARTDPGFSGDSNLWMLPSLEARNPDSTVRTRINGSDLLCNPNQRSSSNTNPQYPTLKTTAGSFVAMKYLENGHVTLPWTLQGKPENGGTVFVFGTSEPRSEERIVDVMQWNKDGSGGDKRGFLLGSMDYDDGECHQINTCWVSAERQILSPNNIPGQDDAQAERWCESDIQIPANVSPGTLAVYWVWDWGTLEGQDCLAPDGRDQYYTNCADIEIVADGGNAKIATDAGPPALGQQDPNTRAVKNFASRTAAASNWSLKTAANWADFNGKIAATSTSGGPPASWLSMCQTSILAEQSAAAANPEALPPLCPPGSYAPTGAEYTAWAASVKARATDAPADSPASATSAPATTAAPASSVPAMAPSSAPASTALPASTAPAAASSAPAPPPAPSPSDTAGAPAGAVMTVTSTQIQISTLTTYVATSPAASSAPAAPAPVPPAASNPAAGAFPTLSTISDPAAGAGTTAPPAVQASAPADAGAGPYGVHVGPDGMGGEYQPARRHAREFGGRR